MVGERTGELHNIVLRYFVMRFLCYRRRGEGSAESRRAEAIYIGHNDAGARLALVQLENALRAEQ